MSAASSWHQRFFRSMMFCAAASIAGQARAAVTFTNNPNPHTPTANPPNDPETVKLTPDPATEAAGASAALQGLMNAFNGGFYTKDGRSINYNPTALNGTLTIDEYQALSGGEDIGSGHLKATYTRAATDPTLANLRWLQMVTTNYPGGASASDANGRRIDGSLTNPATDPFYPFRTSNAGGTGSIGFTDFPERNCRAPHYPGADEVNWGATLLLTSYDGTTLNVYSGVNWGWKLTCPAESKPASVPRTSMTLPSPGGIYVQPNSSSQTHYAGGPGVLTTTSASLTHIASGLTQQVGSNQMITFNADYSGLINFNGNSPTSFQLHGIAQMLINNRTGESEGDFATEVISMQMSGTAVIPGLGAVPLMLRESPTLASLGNAEGYGTAMIDASDSPAGAHDGPYLISSFFDVFTELSLDGGLSWMPSDGSTHIELMPEPGVLSLAAMASLGLLRRRRK